MLLSGSRDGHEQIRARRPKVRSAGSSGDPAEQLGVDSIVADGSDVCNDGALAQESVPAVDFEATLLNQALPTYEILGTLDRGGQGIVYRALQRSTGRVVALKVLHADPGTSRRREQRFAREVELVSRLRHPHVVTIFDSGVAAGRPYLSMELIDGLSIDDYVLVNSPTVRECVVLFEKICRAVASVHQRGVIHRDLKPSNIRVDLEGEPHILDFGLAKCADDEEGQLSLSVAGQVVGTLPFLSPEQITGDDGGVDIRTDIYALGVILHLLLIGEMPYPIDGPRPEVANNIVRRVPGRLDRRGFGDGAAGAIGPISIDLSHIVLKALAKEKDRRYQSADALADDLRRYLDGDAIAARGDGFMYFVRVALRKYRVHSMVAGAFVLLLAVSAITMGVMWQRSDRIARDATNSLAMGRNVRLGGLARDEGRVTAAIELCNEIIKIYSTIKYPTVDDHRSLYSAHHDLAQVYMQTGEIEPCKLHCETAMSIASSLAEANKGVADYQKMLGLANRLMGRYALVEGDHETAQSFFEKSIASLASLPKSGVAMNDAPLDYETLLSQQYLAQVFLKRKIYDQALTLFESVQEGLIEVRKSYPKSNDYLIALFRNE